MKHGSVLLLAALAAAGVLAAGEERLPVLPSPLPHHLLARDSLNMRLVGSWPFGPAAAVAVDPARHLVFCGAGAGTYILDVTDPSAPQVRSSHIRTTSSIRRLIYDGATRRLYLVCADRVEIWDTSVPAGPSRLGAYAVPAGDVAVSGEYAFVAALDSGLMILNVASPADVKRTGRIATSGPALDVAVQDSFAYVAAGYGGLRIINVAKPVAPTEIGHRIDTHYALAVAVSGAYAYLGEGPGIVDVIDISVPSAPTDVTWWEDLPTVNDITVSGSWVYVAYFYPWFGTSWVNIVDVSDPAQPGLASRYGTHGPAQSVAVGGSLLCVADGTGGLNIADVSDPAQAQPITVWQTPDQAADVVVAGGRAYVASGWSGIYNIDLSGMPEPTDTWRCPTKGYVSAVAVAGHYLYATDYHFSTMPGESPEKLRVVDIADPDNPVLVGELMTIGPARDLAVDGRYAYIAEADSGLEVVDVSVPTAPVSVGRFPGERYATYCGLSVAGSHVYVTDWQTVRVIDVSDPANPREIGSCPVHSCWKISVQGSYAYVSTGFDSTLTVVDISTPSAPVPASACLLPDLAGGVSVSGPYAYVACNRAGVVVVDVRDPGWPQIAGYHSTAGSATSTAVVGRRVFVADGDAGLQVYENLLLGVEENQEVPVPRGLAVTARWAGPDLELRLTVPRAGDIKLSVFNALGQEVSSQPMFVKAAGRHTVRIPCADWSEGSYFVRVCAGADAATVKVVKLR